MGSRDHLEEIRMLREMIRLARDTVDVEDLLSG
jgi:hypothetical protein